MGNLFQSLSGFLMVATSSTEAGRSSTYRFQSLSGFLMVATSGKPPIRGEPISVSIPIGFSNGCNRMLSDAGGVLRGLFQSLSGFLMVATAMRRPILSRPRGFNPYRVF